MASGAVEVEFEGDKELLESAVELMEWIREKKANIIVLKGSAATPLRGFLREVWKSLGYPAKEFPKLYSTGQLTSSSSSVVKRSPEARKAVEEALARKLEKTHTALARDLQEARNTIVLVDEVCQSGFGLRAVEDFLKRQGKAKVYSAALTTLGPNPDYPPDFLGRKVFPKRLQAIVQYSYASLNAFLHKARMARGRNTLKQDIKRMKFERQAAEKDLHRLAKKARPKHKRPR